MFKAYRYLFYRIYSWNLKTWGRSDGPQYNTIMGMTVLSLFNIICLISIIEIIIGIYFFRPSDIPKFFLVIIYCVVLIINYFVFVYKKKYKKIGNEFKNEREAQKRKRTYYIWLYIIGSIIGPFIFGALIYILNKNV